MLNSSDKTYMNSLQLQCKTDLKMCFVSIVLNSTIIPKYICNKYEWTISNAHKYDRLKNQDEV